MSTPTTPPRWSATGLLLLGLVLGLAGALTYAWLINPIVYTEASPARLSETYQRDYILLVSQNYAVDNDLRRAEERLTALGSEDVAQETAVLLETLIREQQNPETIRQLALLARQLGAESSAIALLPQHRCKKKVPPQPHNLAHASPHPNPAQHGTANEHTTPHQHTHPAASYLTNAPPAYRLLNQQRVCDPAAARIEVITWDTLLDPLPGAEVLVSWQGGNDRFFTGFKPAAEPDYGDFAMEADVSYTVTLAEGSTPISGLRLEPCPNGELGGWRLTFQHLTRRSNN